MELDEILKVGAQKGASDVHLKVGLPPIFRIDSVLYPVKNLPRFTAESLSDMIFSIMTESQKKNFRNAHEIDLSYGVKGLGRFRVNVFQQRGTLGAVLRIIPMNVKSPEELHLPKVIERLAEQRRGLILVTGTTGSGKSTTLASMIDYINSSRTAHIITIEDPVEFLHRDKKSVITQREVGFDTLDFSGALRSSLRQDPDVILVGEMRDVETIEIAITAAETGHLVLSTLHTLDAKETINRIVSVFPPHTQHQVRLALSGVLKGVISQRLVVRADGKGRVPAVEVLVSTSRIRECIAEEEKLKEIPDAIAAGHTMYGMQTFDQSLMGLLKKNFITYDDAMKNATNPDDFALKMQGVSSSSDSQWSDFEKEKEKKPEKGDDIDIERF
ncbi:MAG: type IV pilus twitching motility protein PilT [Deltaproteobacteria bacterium]|nr:type IV pilus twitching motility protein PilT [Deltaproteobacteria bacterium]